AARRGRCWPTCCWPTGRPAAGTWPSCCSPTLTTRWGRCAGPWPSCGGPWARPACSAGTRWPTAWLPAWRRTCWPWPASRTTRRRRSASRGRWWRGAPAPPPHGLRAGGGPGEAVAYAARAVARNPLEEGNHELLVRCLAAAGDRSAALRQVAVCEDTLRRELGVEPSPALRDAADTSAGAPAGLPVSGR